MATKKYDIAVAVGEYESNGEKKKRYQNVGVVMQGDNGPYILIERWFNPAGIANPDNRGNLILSLFEPRDGNKQQSSAPAQQPAPEHKRPGKFDDFDDDIPF